MTVTEVLILIPRTRLGRIVAPTAAGSRRLGGHDDCSRRQVKSNIALQMNRVTKILPWAEYDIAAASAGGSSNRLVDRARVESFTITGSAEGFYVMFDRDGRAGRGLRRS